MAHAIMKEALAMPSRRKQQQQRGAGPIDSVVMKELGRGMLAAPPTPSAIRPLSRIDLHATRSTGVCLRLNPRRITPWPEERTRHTKGTNDYGASKQPSV